ncbi:MAG: hypothetical protein M5U28_19705 [Sandaracinaceae bacterium]|nr:hypothetical protein [Sandaracinaceae bacterium]
MAGAAPRTASLSNVVGASSGICARISSGRASRMSWHVARHPFGERGIRRVPDLDRHRLPVHLDVEAQHPGRVRPRVGVGGGGAGRAVAVLGTTGEGERQRGESERSTGQTDLPRSQS